MTGDSGTYETFTFDPLANGFTFVKSVPFTGAIGAGPDANFINWKGFGWATTESGGASGFGGITAYNPITGNLALAYNLLGGNDGSVPTGNLLGLGDSLYGVAAYSGIGQHGLAYSLQPCSGLQDFQPPAINGAIYNSLNKSLYINYTGSLPTSSPLDPTTQMWGTLYNAGGTPSSLDTFNFSTQGGGTFTDSHMFHVATMPSSVALYFFEHVRRIGAFSFGPGFGSPRN